MEVWLDEVGMVLRGKSAKKLFGTLMKNTLKKPAR
jgi:hypothetical protein